MSIELKLLQVLSNSSVNNLLAKSGFKTQLEKKKKNLTYSDDQKASLKVHMLCFK